MANLIKNPWGRSGKYWENSALANNVLDIIQGKTGYSESDSVKRIYINNASNKKVYYKPENGTTPVLVKPNSKSYEPFDGVITHKYCNKVYKVFTGVAVDIDNNGNVDPDFYGVGDLANILAGGGWKDIEWLSARQALDDDGWNEIFELSATICNL